jgi:hypothetical protein
MIDAHKVCVSRHRASFKISRAAEFQQDRVPLLFQLNPGVIADPVAHCYNSTMLSVSPRRSGFSPNLNVAGLTHLTLATNR